MTTLKDNLLAFVASECTPIDREECFDQMLDECYSFALVGGIFSNMSPSSVLRECDPIAYRCGVNDYADGEEWVEIDGDYYESDEVEKARGEFVSNLESEVSDLESEIGDLNEEDDASEILDLTARLDSLRADVTAAKRYSF